MNLMDAIAAEYGQETGLTRRMLERVPEERFGWKPHEKSRTMGELVCHIVGSQVYVKRILEAEQFNVSEAGQPFEAKAVSVLLEGFDERVTQAQTVMKDVSDEAAMQMWKLLDGGQTIVEMPRIAALRGFVLSHMIHHRGQLSVYLRENGVPLPAIYGPSADEQM